MSIDLSFYNCISTVRGPWGQRRFLKTSVDLLSKDPRVQTVGSLFLIEFKVLFWVSEKRKEGLGSLSDTRIQTEEDCIWLPSILRQKAYLSRSNIYTCPWTSHTDPLSRSLRFRRPSFFVLFGCFFESKWRWNKVFESKTLKNRISEVSHYLHPSFWVLLQTYQLLI